MNRTMLTEIVYNQKILPHIQCVLVYMYANNVKDRWVHSSKNFCWWQV